MAAIIGGSLAGAKSFTSTSGPGMSLKQENLGFAYITETPCVVINVMRGGPSTGLPTVSSQADIMQARWGTHGDHPVIALTPSTVLEQFTETVRAFNLSEKYRMPVVILTDEIMGHAREAMEVPKPGELEVIDRQKPKASPADYKPFDISKGDIPPMANFGEGYRFHVTGLIHDEMGFPKPVGSAAEEQIKRLQRKIDDNYDDIVEVDEIMCDDAEVIVFAVGIVARAAKDAIKMARAKGIKAGLMKPRTIWPFPHKHIEKYKGKAKRIVVAEMNLGQMIGEVQRVAAGAIEVKGLLRADGDSPTPTQIVDALTGA
jgi:2-oxoglutarate ferredoxin oxidoreductase subunit alpha